MKQCCYRITPNTELWKTKILKTEMILVERVSCWTLIRKTNYKCVWIIIFLKNVSTTITVRLCTVKFLVIKRGILLFCWEKCNKRHTNNYAFLLNKQLSFDVSFSFDIYVYGSSFLLMKLVRYMIFSFEEVWSNNKPFSNLLCYYTFSPLALYL